MTLRTLSLVLAAMLSSGVALGQSTSQPASEPTSAPVSSAPLAAPDSQPSAVTPPSASQPSATPSNLQPPASPVRPLTDAGHSDGESLTPSRPAPDIVAKAGILGAGINLEPLAIGLEQGLSKGGASSGLSMAIALQIDVGPRWAFRLPIDFASSFSNDFGTVAFTPGLMYRFRQERDQQVVPYVGGGLRLGTIAASRPLLGLPAVQSIAFYPRNAFEGGGGGGGGSSLDVHGDVSPELWGGLEWHPSRWFSVNLGGALVPTTVTDVRLVLLRESLGLRVSF